MNNTTEFTKIWGTFPEKLEEMLERPHKLFLKIIQERFGKWRMKKNLFHEKIETSFPKKDEGNGALRFKKNEGDITLDKFTNFSIVIYNYHTLNTDESCYKRWKDIRFLPQTLGNEKSSGVKVKMCIRDGYTKERFEHNRWIIESRKTDCKDSTVEISAFDNKKFVNFINKWMREFPEELKAVEFEENGSRKK